VDVLYLRHGSRDTTGETPEKGMTKGIQGDGHPASACDSPGASAGTCMCCAACLTSCRLACPSLRLLPADAVQCSTTTRCLSPPAAYLPLPAGLPLYTDLQPGPVATSRHSRPPRQQRLAHICLLISPTLPGMFGRSSFFQFFNCLIVLKVYFLFCYILSFI